MGSTVTFTYLVTNTGNAPPLRGDGPRRQRHARRPLRRLQRGPFAGGDADADGLLDPAERWTFTASPIATAPDSTPTPASPPAQDANNPPGTTVTDDNPANYEGISRRYDRQVDPRATRLRRPSSPASGVPRAASSRAASRLRNAHARGHRAGPWYTARRSMASGE